jgi:uncharacterized protein
MRLSRRQFLGYGLGVLLLASSVTTPSAASPDEVVILRSPHGPVPIRVEVVDTPETRTLGLMHRRHLAADAGMLFAYDRPAPIGMWMKNTLIPLDMLFIDEAGVIAAIAENTEPLSLTPIRAPRPVLAVLEVNAGTTRKLGIVVGDRVEHRIFAPAAD